MLVVNAMGGQPSTMVQPRHGAANQACVYDHLGRVALPMPRGAMLTIQATLDPT